MFEIKNSNFTPANNVLAQLFDMEYQKVIQCVSDTSFQS